MIPKIALCSRSLRSSSVFSRPFKVLQRPWTESGSGSPAATRGIHVDSLPIIPTLTTSYAHGTSTTSLVSTTVGETLLKTVERTPDREALVFMQDRVRKTFAELQQDVDQLAAGLLALGLQKGDRLGMWGPNTYEWVLFQFATARAGIILVSVNPAYQVHEVEFAMQRSGCKAIVCPSKFKTQKFCDMLRQICPEIETSTPGDIRSARLPNLRSVIVLDKREPGMLYYEDVMQAGSSQYVQQLQDLQKKLSCDDPINIQFTSGTTGTPKGATLSHHNIINNSCYVGKRVGYTWRPNTRICLPVPLYHCFGSVGGSVAMAVHGITAVFPSPGYDGRANLEALESERCTFIYGTPTMYVDMISQQEQAKYDLSTLRSGVIGGSPCPPELVKRIISEMGIKEVINGYGSTETSTVTFCGSPTGDNIERKTETVGFIMDHTEAKIVSPITGEVVPLGVSGELMVRGYCVMLGYWEEEAKTKQSITNDRWYKTGDIASMDAYSYCRIEGRITDMVIRGGENIYPAEIEQFLFKNPKVKEAQVVGVEDARMGEELCACIKLMDGEDCTVEEIKAYCKGQISHFKIPRYVLFMTSFPLTVTGKIQKVKLRDEAEQQLGLKKGK